MERGPGDGSRINLLSQGKSMKARICLEKTQTCRTLLPGQTVIDFMLQLTCYSALHLGEWASKIQIFHQYLERLRDYRLGMITGCKILLTVRTRLIALTPG